MIDGHDYLQFLLKRLLYLFVYYYLFNYKLIMCCTKEIYLYCLLIPLIYVLSMYYLCICVTLTKIKRLLFLSEKI